MLPTTPFLLLAALCFSKGSDKIYQWLITHPTLGPPINDWREKRAITRRSKIVATASMLILLAITPLVGALPVGRRRSGYGNEHCRHFFVATGRALEDSAPTCDASAQLE